MTPLVVAAVLMAAVTHASWNAIAHGIRDQLLAFTLVGGGGAVCGVALAAVSPLPAAGAWPFLLASAVLHIVYQALLMQSFRLGDFGQMYPIARGTAPLVVTVLAAVFVHEIPDGWALAGVALASAGLVGVALWGIRGSGTRPHWPALLAALATGLAIASYTTVDGLGVPRLRQLPRLYRLADDPRRHRDPRLRARHPPPPTPHRTPPVRPAGLAGGVLSVFAYGLVLWAQTRAPLAPIAALRESSIIVGAAIGALFFKERFGAPRIAAAGLMVIGIGLMLHTG